MPTTDGPSLSLRQQQILTFIKDSTDNRGFPPSIREVAAGVGLSSTRTVRYHINILEEQGHLTRVRNSQRTYQVVTDPKLSHSGSNPANSACHFLTPGNSESTSGTVYVLQIVLGPAAGHALLNGAQLTVEQDGQHSLSTPVTDHATILGRVVAVAHPL
ncbi:transcriptional repressor, LexA family [Actinobacteria bacterium OK074]|nr:transcriptional repressor, LexA family [Actinobacteria bacterium OK074]